jgi:hypothetical protein
MLKDTLPTVSVKSFFSLGITPGVGVEEELRTEELDCCAPALLDLDEDDVFCVPELLAVRTDELDEPCPCEAVEEDEFTTLLSSGSDEEDEPICPCGSSGGMIS